jgi:hypothetical protein
MNKARRAAVEQAKTLIEKARLIVENCRDEEQDVYDNMPENLQGSERGQKVEAASDALSEAIDSLETAESACDTAMED